MVSVLHGSAVVAMVEQGQSEARPASALPRPAEVVSHGVLLSSFSNPWRRARLPNEAAPLAYARRNRDISAAEPFAGRTRCCLRFILPRSRGTIRPPERAAKVRPFSGRKRALGRLPVRGNPACSPGLSANLR